MMSELNNPPKDCRFMRLKNDRLICVTHDQSLLYVFINPNGVCRFICQVGEDEKATFGKVVQKK